MQNFKRPTFGLSIPKESVHKCLIYTAQTGQGLIYLQYVQLLLIQEKETI